MMDYYLNTVFKKMSMIRTDEKKGIVEKRRQRAQSTLAILWLMILTDLCALFFLQS